MNDVLTPEILAIELPHGYGWRVVGDEPAIKRGLKYSWITLQQLDPQKWAIRYVDPEGGSWYPYGRWVQCTMYEACQMLAKAIWMDMRYDA